MTNMNTRRLSVLAITMASLMACATADAAPITVPTGLNPGDSYRLAFVTRGTTNAASPNITAYNNFVSIVAGTVPELVSLGTTWKVIGSTSSDKARDNTNTDPGAAVGVPIYSLNDTLLANNNADLWDGSLANALNYDENGTIHSTNPFTGTAQAGAATSAPLGAATGSATTGQSTSAISTWVDTGIDIPLGVYRSFYALSGVLRVVPEPGTFTLVTFGLWSLSLGAWRRRG